jgi:hypothetical protein
MVRRLTPLTKLAVLLLACTVVIEYGEKVASFSLLLMGRKGRGNLKRTLSTGDDATTKKTPKSTASINQGRGQEITGVSLPTVVRFSLDSVW